MAKQPFYKIQNNGNKTVDILIYGVIGDSWYDESVSARRFVTEFNNLEKENDRINIRINSPGGSVFDGLPIYNAIANSKVETHTYNEGLAASMAALILLSGKTVHTANNALMMIHSPSTGAWGNAREIQNVLNALDKVQQSLITCLVDKTGKTKEEIAAAWFDYDDHWFTADEAKTEGFVDEIDEKKAKVPENISNMSFQEVMDRFEKIVPPETAAEKVKHWITNLFSVQNQNTIEDMDPKLLRDAFGLTEKATEEEILDHVKNVVTENATLKQGKEKAEGDLKAVKAEKEKVESEFEEFKKSAGAASAGTGAATDGLKTGDDEDEAAEDFLDAYSACLEVLNPEK
jgi:ATP-dependent Clp endopeptidase proteolytic subunit ClpP